MRLIYLLALIPVIDFLGGAFFANRVHPYVLGMPFLTMVRSAAPWRFGSALLSSRSM
jgi:hypothetical protein